METRDPELKTRGSGSVIGLGEVVGIAVAVPEENFIFQLLMALDQTWIKKNFRMVQRYLWSPATKIFHNAMYDVCWIRKLGIKINGLVVDTMIAASLIDENRFQYSLNALSWDYLGHGKSELR